MDDTEILTEARWRGLKRAAEYAETAAKAAWLVHLLLDGKMGELGDLSWAIPWVTSAKRATDELSEVQLGIQHILFSKTNRDIARTVYQKDAEAEAKADAEDDA